MGQHPGISVIIPTFNRAGRVILAIDSVLNQDYPPEAMQVVVVDDGSSDGTVERLRSRYGNRICVFEQPNQGPSAARNRGVEAARHRLVAFLDSDDQWLPSKLQKQASAMESSGAILSYSNWTQAGCGSACDRFS